MNIPTLTPPPKPSSNVLGIGYDSVLRNLFIEFKFTGVYKYNDVTDKVYEKLLKADSIGRFIATEIAPNHHYEKITNPTK